MCLGLLFPVFQEKLLSLTVESFYVPPEFQNVLKTFSKMKGGRVAIDEVTAFLDGVGIPVNPKMLKDVISHTYVDSELPELCLPVLLQLLCLLSRFSLLLLVLLTDIGSKN